MMTSRQALLIFQLWVISEFEDAKRNLTRTFGIRHQTYKFCKYDEYIIVWSCSLRNLEVKTHMSFCSRTVFIIIVALLRHFIIS